MGGLPSGSKRAFDAKGVPPIGGLEANMRTVCRSMAATLVLGLALVGAPAGAQEWSTWSEPIEGLFTLTYPSSWAVQQSRYRDVLLLVNAPAPEQAACEVNR